MIRLLVLCLFFYPGLVLAETFAAETEFHYIPHKDEMETYLDIHPWSVRAAEPLFDLTREDEPIIGCVVTVVVVVDFDQMSIMVSEPIHTPWGWMGLMQFEEQILDLDCQIWIVS